MTPSLARRGKLILASGGAFALVGAMQGAAPLVALGGLAVSALLSAYLWFFPAAILLRRRKVELSWWVPPGDQPGGALTADRPFALHVALRNHGGRRLRVLGVEILATSAVEPPRGLEAVMPAGCAVELRGRAVARAAGYQVLHGAVLRFGDILGLFDLSAYFPNPIAIKVFPREAGARPPAAMRPIGGSEQERVGVHQLRRRGLAGELRELRDHAHGDSFKFIAWKATARRRKLMVRDLETEIVVTHQFLVDTGASMRDGPPGRSKLDAAIELTCGLARAALDGGDRAGLITFDARVGSELRPGDGHRHYLELVDRLIESRSVVDEDRTALTGGELVSVVARYLSHQEALDVRLRRAPPLDDPAWERIQAGPRGDLYDMDALGKLVDGLLASMQGKSQRRKLAPASWWSKVRIDPDSDPVMARLRLFCRLRGIELPYRRDHEHGKRAAGLAEALRRAAAAGRADQLVLISDLGGLLEDPDQVFPALARARRRGQLAVALVPFSPAFAPAPQGELGERVADVMSRDETARLDTARRLLAQRGVPLIAFGPQDSPAALQLRIARAGHTARRAA